MIQKTPVNDLGRLSLEDYKESEKLPLIIVLDNVRSMLNVGSIFRTGDAFAVQKIFLCGITPAPPHREIHKTALGSEHSVEWEYAENAESVLSNLLKNGAFIWAVEQTNASKQLHQIDIEKSKLHVLVLGNEVDGVSEAALKLSNGFVEIPQWGTKHSLNVAVAAGVVMWHFASALRHSK